MIRSNGPSPDREPVPSPAIAHQSHEKAFSTAGSEHLQSGGDERNLRVRLETSFGVFGGRQRRHLHAQDLPATSSKRADGSKPVVPRGGHVQENSPRVQQDVKNRVLAGADKSDMPDDGETIYACAEHKPPPVVKRAARCEYTGCARTPRYGRIDES
ncbi:unnamed protein product, partial [Pylaiella littoralis]